LNLDYSIDETVLKKSKSWILDNIESVNHVYLAGGEPLLIKENQDLLTFLLEKKPEVEIRINSNLSNINTPVFRQLIKFKNVKWTISVDSQKDCFEYMRWPGSWKNLLSNLKIVQNIAGDQINFNMVWCILNDIDILDTIDFLLDFGFHENMFIVQCLTTPFPLSILNLPKNLRTDLKRKIQIRQQTCNPDWWLYKSLQSMYNFLDQEMPTKDVKKIYQGTLELHPGLEGTFKYLEFIDNLRNLDSKKLFARLYQLR
jgi:hypothetical protein